MCISRKIVAENQFICIVEEKGVFNEASLTIWNELV